MTEQDPRRRGRAAGRRGRLERLSRRDPRRLSEAMVQTCIVHLLRHNAADVPPSMSTEIN